jgi:hypothetical protein
MSVARPSVDAMTEQHIDEHAQERELHGLTRQQADILDFERHWWKYAGAKDTAIRERFDIGWTRYYQVLNALLDHPGAVAYDPLLVHRLTRLRAARQRQRAARRLA